MADVGADHAVRQQLDTGVVVEVFGVEESPEVVGGDLGAMLVGMALHDRAELDLQAARHHQTMVALEQEGDAALARLAVDADDRFIGPAEVGRVERQIRDLPERVGLLDGKAFFDRVLVRAREGSKHQIADIGMTRMDRQLIAVLDRAGHLIDVGEVELGVDAL